MNKIKEIGKMALGSRLRALSDSLVENAKAIYELYDVPLKPKWFPVFYTITKNETMTIGNIAAEIGHSHPSVVKIVKELNKAGIAHSAQDEKDARKTNISLTAKGQNIAQKIEFQYKDVNAAVEQLLNDQTHDLWKALDELEFLLDEKSMFRRVLEQKKQRESKLIKIIEYTPDYKAAFKELNQAWIEQYFKMEESDFKSLDNPKEYILDKGGTILVALYEADVAGVCALIKMTDDKYELAKMAVAETYQGKGIGSILGKAVIEKARELGAKTVYLESNTILKPAINLYHKLGFKKVPGTPSPYERSNIQMEHHLE